MKKTFIILDVLGALFTVANAITCYSCNGETNFRDYEKCKDEFSGLADVKYCSTQCLKIKYEHMLFERSWYRVERGCASIFDKREEEWCTTTGQFIYGSGTKITTCYCKDELCNTGAFTTTSMMTAVTVFVSYMAVMGIGIV